MKTTRIFLYASLLGLALTGCTADDAQQPAAQQDAVPVALTATTLEATATRAATGLNEGSIASGEQVAVRLSSDASTTYTFEAGASGALTDKSASKAYYPEYGASINIYAYYPSTAGSSFTVQSDQSSDANYKASDLMTASALDKTKESGTVALAFTHQMAKIIVNATPANSSVAISEITLKSVKPTVAFTPANATVGETSGTATDIKVTTSGTGAAVIPAQTFAKDATLLTIKTSGGGTATYKLGAAKTFEAGHVYTLNIEVSQAQVGTTTTITGWSSEGVANIYLSEPGIALASATVGQILAERNGNTRAFNTMQLAVDNGFTPKAIVAYVGATASVESAYHGLALSLKDAGGACHFCEQTSETCLDTDSRVGKTDNNAADAKAKLNGMHGTAVYLAGKEGHTHAAATQLIDWRKNNVHPAGTSEWFLPSLGQWNLMVLALAHMSVETYEHAYDNSKADSNNTVAEDILPSGISTWVIPYWDSKKHYPFMADDVNVVLEKAGVNGNTTGGVATSIIQASGYWSSTECSATLEWRMLFGSGYVRTGGKTSSIYVRPVLAF